MRTMLLGFAAAMAAVTLPAAGAQAQQFSANSEFNGGHGSPGFDNGVTFHRGDGDRGDRRDRRRNRGDVFIGEWPQQGDTLWRSDSFNDWWHERPLRSTPRWVFSNQDCARRYWSGGGWRC